MKIGAITMLLISLSVCVPVALAAVTTSSAPAPPNFYITSNTSDLCKGLVNYIPITLTNGGIPEYLNIGGTNTKGPAMDDIQLGLSGTKSGYLIGNGTVSVPPLNATNSTSVNIPVFINANASSVLSLGISINYYFDTFYEDSEVRNLTFGTETCNSPLRVDISPQALTTQTRENITFNLTNNGSTTLNSITLHVTAPSTDLAWLTSQTIQVPHLMPKSSAHVNETVYVAQNASQLFPLNFSANYFYNNSRLGQISDSIIMLSGGIISIEPSSLTTSPSPVTPGSIVSISFILTNLGTSSASTVIVTPTAPPGFVPFGSNSVFVGTIAPSGQSPVTLTFTIANNTKAGNYQIPVEVSYLNSLRSNLSISFNTSVEVGAAGFALGASSNASQVAVRRNFSGGGFELYGILTPILAITTIVFLSLYIRERRKRRHAK
jgi:hypothetical protein